MSNYEDVMYDHENKTELFSSGYTPPPRPLTPQEQIILDVMRMHLKDDPYLNAIQNRFGKPREPKWMIVWNRSIRNIRRINMTNGLKTLWIILQTAFKGHL